MPLTERERAIVPEMNNCLNPQITSGMSIWELQKHLEIQLLSAYDKGYKAGVADQVIRQSTDGENQQ